jgi:hypothetical protein
MSTLAKSTLLSLSLLAGTAFVAYAQSGSVAALPPGAAAPAATAPVGPMNPYPGPNPGSGANIAGGQTQQAGVAPSPAYVGPPAGAGNGHMPPRFEKSADYDSNTSLHPYSSAQGPRPN